VTRSTDVEIRDFIAALKIPASQPGRDTMAMMMGRSPRKRARHHLCCVEGIATRELHPKSEDILEIANIAEGG
jgi:hypothetical protein